MGRLGVNPFNAAISLTEVLLQPFLYSRYNVAQGGFKYVVALCEI